MGDPKRPPSRVGWDANLGGMLKQGASVKALCRDCGCSVPIDVAQAIELMGAEVSLWDWVFECLACEMGLMTVHAQPGLSTPFRPLLTYMVVTNLNQAGWMMIPVWPGQCEWLNGRQPYPYSG